MPRFYVDLQPGNDRVFIDDEGIELPDIHAARIEAWYALRDLVVDHLAGEIGPTVVHVVVRSEGEPLLRFEAKIDLGE